DGIRSVLRVDPSGQLLGADQEHVAGVSGADRVRGDGEAVAEPGAGTVDVERARRVDAQFRRDRGGGVGDLGLDGAGGGDDGVVVGGGQPGGGGGGPAGGGAQGGEGLVRLAIPPFDDAHPAADPFVVGIDRLGEVVVGDDPLGAVVPEPGDAGPGGERW